MKERDEGAMAKIHLTDELLMAFADGELDDSMASAVEQAMAEDPSGRQRIAAFMRSRRLVRQAFTTADALAVPAALAAQVSRQVAASEAFSGVSSNEFSPQEALTRETRPRETPGPEASAATALPRPLPRTVRRAPPWLLMAASLAALAIGLGGFAIGRQTSLGPRTDVDFLARLDAPEVDGVLGSLPSGSEAALELGRMRVVATYRTAGGSLCREFKVAGQAGEADAVACRPNDARPLDSWTLAFAQTDPIPQAGTAPRAPAERAPSYAPADGSSLVDTYLQGVGAGDPLDRSAEQKALGR